MSKYVIKACPCYIPKNGYCIGRATKYCEDAIYCPIKQIVENLKQVAYAGHCDNCDGCGYDSGCGDTECGTYQALKSLELLEIQEVE